MLGKRLIKSNDSGGGCTDIVDNYDPFGGNGVALYQLNGNANDVSGNYNGTASNVTYGAGQFGQAGVFANSSSSRIEANAAILPADVFSVSMWMKVTNLSDNKWILTQYTGGVTGRFVFSYNADGGLQINVSSSNSGTSITERPIVENVWQHIVLIKNGSSGFQIYVDNQSIGTWSNTSNIITNQNTVFGGNQNVTTQSIDGQLDQVRIFNEALTPLEVEALYTEELCICDGTVDTLDILGDGSCIATYPLDGNANDLSGNYSGTPTNVSYGVGEFGQAAQFNGSNAIIDTPVIPITNTTTFTNSSWVYISSLSVGNIIPFSQVSSSNSNTFISIAIRPSSNNVELVRRDTSSVGIVVYEPYTWSVGWHHVVWVCTPTNSKLYVNGSQIANTDYTQTSPLSFTTQSIGGRLRPVQMLYAEGSIDQVRIFNKALSAGEVTTLYNETACTKVTRTSGDTQILGDSSCVGYYKLDGNANDETGNYNGTFTNPNYGNGEFDYAAVFNGSSNYINLPDNSFKLSTITVSAWINSASTQNLQTIYSSYEYQSLQSRGFGIRLQDSNLILFQAYNSNTNSNVFSSSQIQRNTWNHIVVVAGQSSVSIYINGSLDNSGSISGFDYFTNHPFSIGKNAQALEHYFDGSIDQVRIFNRAINASEVTTLYNEGI